MFKFEAKLGILGVLLGGSLLYAFSSYKSTPEAITVQNTEDKRRHKHTQQSYNSPIRVTGGHNRVEVMLNDSTPSASANAGAAGAQKAS